MQNYCRKQFYDKGHWGQSYREFWERSWRHNIIRGQASVFKTGFKFTAPSHYVNMIGLVYAHPWLWRKKGCRTCRQHRWSRRRGEELRVVSCPCRAQWSSRCRSEDERKGWRRRRRDRSKSERNRKFRFNLSRFSHPDSYPNDLPGNRIS